ncbi:MAG: 16S rRNA (uracil(1498)-N(3))-methyltransferase [Desulfatiglandaceae bacterium]
MRRFFVERIAAPEGRLAISGTEAKHMTRVLRMGPGDRFVLIDRAGLRFQALIESVRQKDLTILLEKPLPTPPASPLKIVLGQAVLKSRAMAYVIQKGSELGVDAIRPFISERTVVRATASKSENSTRRWRELAIAASKQADRSGPLEIPPTVSFETILQHPVADNTLKFVLWEEEEARGLKATMKTLSHPKAIVALVGPEGGFSREEIRSAEEGGFFPVSLGRRILRAETAAIVMAAILQYEWGDLSPPFAQGKAPNLKSSE